MGSRLGTDVRTEGATVEELVLADALVDCLDAIEGGETDLDALADRYPSSREEIRPLLDIAQALLQWHPLKPSYGVPARP